MRKFLLLIMAALSGTCSVSAQTYPLFNTSENIDIGNIKAAHLVHGDMWWDPSTTAPRCEFPKGSGKSVAYSSSLWMGGYDTGKVLRVAAQTYRQKGTDFWPGPIDTGTLQKVSYATSQKWAKIWKINHTQLDTFLKVSTHTIANTPLPILEWPAKGNPYAKGAGGAALTINQPLAPFVDVNADGLYNPLSGDYPVMKGDQMLWWIINDTGATVHQQSETPALGVDIAITAYTYHRNTISDRIIFYEYLIKNHSAISYDSFRVGVFADVDLGNAFDDYIGFDSSRRLGVVYNGKSVDGAGAPSDYGNNPPMAGIVVMELPGDAPNTYVPLATFNIFLNSPSNPSTGLQFYRTLEGYVGSNPPTRQPFYLLQSEDDACVKNYMPGDHRMVIAAGKFTFNAGSATKIAFALVASDGAGGCPLMEFGGINAVTDTAYKYYWNPPAAQPTSVSNANQSQLRLYPNPTKEVLYLETGDAQKRSVTIFNSVGQATEASINYSSNTIEITTVGLPPGLYSIRYKDEHSVKTGVFIKQ